MEIQFSKAKAIPNKSTSDSWYNKLQVIVPKKQGLLSGQKVEIKSPVYSGIHTIGYIYRGATVDAVYFKDIQFTADTAGTLKKVTGVTAPQPKNPNPGAQVNNPGYPVTTPVNKAQPTNPGTEQPDFDPNQFAQDVKNQVLNALGMQDPQPVNDQATAKASMLSSKSWLTYGVVGVIVLIVIMKLFKK